MVDRRAKHPRVPSFAPAIEAVGASFPGFLEAVPDAIVIVGQDGCIQLINGHTERLFGYDRAELTGHPIEILVPSRYRPNHQGHRSVYFSGPYARPMGAGVELFAARKDGTEFPAEISLGPIETERGLLVMAAIRDVTGRKRAEELSIDRRFIHRRDCRENVRRNHHELEQGRGAGLRLLGGGDHRQPNRDALAPRPARGGVRGHRNAETWRLRRRVRKRPPAQGWSRYRRLGDHLTDPRLPWNADWHELRSETLRGLSEVAHDE